MKKIKIIEGLEPWEVLKAASEGKSIAVREENGWEKAMWSYGSYSVQSYIDGIIAIIDDSQPEIDWDGFDWGFFNQYGGLRCHYGENVKGVSILSAPDDQQDLTISESPFYYWPGGKQPVPDNVEVEVVVRNGSYSGGAAGDLRWRYENDTDFHRREFQDIIAFRLTGRVL